ncbi:hypothetical protein AKJ16_DCAP06630 [Drosera capensis]
MIDNRFRFDTLVCIERKTEETPRISRSRGRFDSSAALISQRFAAIDRRIILLDFGFCKLKLEGSQAPS